MAEVHEGGCLCGAIRYRVKDSPLRAGVCHCTFCQRRTGSAFGINVHFDKENVEVTGDGLKTFEHHSDESNRWVRVHFCDRCGTTVMVSVEKHPGIRFVMGGTLDDPNWIKISKHIWTRSAQRWMVFPESVDCLEKGGPEPT